MTDLNYSTIFKKIKKRFPNIDFLNYLESGTSSKTRFLNQLQERFQNISKEDGVSLLILTPEELNFLKNIATTAATYKIIDDEMIANKICEEFFKDRLKRVGVDFEDVHSLQNFNTLIELFQTVQKLDDNAFAFPVPYDAFMINGRIEINKSLNIVVMPHYSVIDMNFFNSVPKATLKLKEKGIDPDDVYKNVVFHELGHALEKENALKGYHHLHTNDTILNNLNRYRTECIADVFAVLQMARLRGNTDLAEVGLMVRAKYLHDSYKYFKEENDEMQEKIYNDLVETYGETGFSEEHIQDAVLTSNQLRMKELGKYMHYFTVIPIDYARKTANKMLKDGSLMAMSDKEVLDLSVQLAKDSMFEKNQLLTMFHNIINGNTDNELFHAMNQYTKASFEYFGIPDKETQLSEKRKKEKKEKYKREIGFETEENGLDYEKRKIAQEERKKANVSKLVREADLRGSSIRTSHFEHIIKAFPDYSKYSLPERHMLYTLETMKYGVESVEKIHKEYSSNYSRRGYDFIVTEIVCGAYRDHIINSASNSSASVMILMSFKDEYMKDDSTNHKGNIYQLIAKFVKLHAENIKLSDAFYGNKAPYRFPISTNDYKENNKTDLKNLKTFAKKENAMRKIAKQIRESEEFTSLKTPYSQLFHHINNFQDSRGMPLSSEYYMNYYFEANNFDKRVHLEKAIFREIFKQKGCGIFIASKLSKSERNAFLNSLKVFNGHHLIKTIEQELLQRNIKSRQK